MSRAGFTVWLTGPPRAGKSTLAALLARALRSLGLSVQVLEGKDMRRQLSPELGFGPEDCRVHALRTAHVAQLLNQNGVCCLVAQIAPLAAHRQEARRHIAELVEVHLDCSLEQRINRDPDGLYARALAGQVSGLPGLDAPYEPPADPEAHCQTDRQSIEQSLAVVLDYLAAAGLLPAAGAAEAATTATSATSDDAYTPQQEALIRRRLADLGYL